MPRCQENAYIALSNSLPELVKQLKIANRLKALELKAKNHDGQIHSFITPELLDDILAGK